MQNFQGDISIITLTENQLPKDLIFKKLDKVVVAEGETTGHKHLLVADRFLAGADLSDCEIAQDANGFYIRVISGSATLKHEEHDLQVIPIGVHYLGRQWEYDEISERKVQD